MSHFELSIGKIGKLVQAKEAADMFLFQITVNPSNLRHFTVG